MKDLKKQMGDLEWTNAYSNRVSGSPRCPFPRSRFQATEAQAKTAALSICGDNRVYDQLPWFWSDQYDVKLQTAGLMQEHDEVVVEGDVAARKFTVSYFRGGKMIALDAINSPALFMKAKKRICMDLQVDN